MDMYKAGILEIADSLKGVFYKEKYAFLQQIGEFQTYRDILCALYNVLVKQAMIIKIEDLTEEEYGDLLMEAKKLTTSENGKTLVQICKSLHAFGTYIQL